MFDTASSALTQYIPAFTTTVPLLGEVDIQKLLLAVGIFVGLTAVFWFIRMIVLVRLEALAKRSVAQLDDTIVAAIQSIRVWVYSLIALFVALQLYTLPDLADRITTGVLYLVFVWQGIQVASCFINYLVTTFLEKDEDGDGVVDPGAATMAGMVTLIARIVMWTLGIIFVLSNIGIEVTSLIAGLGIGGVAVAFALQGVLSDLFASFSIYFDRPFRIGDFIVVGADAGTVEKIGIKTTRIRTLQGEELVVSNAELTTARVQNFKKMEERHIFSQFGITYETAPEKVRQVNDVVVKIFDGIEHARLDRTHFKSFGDSALIFEVVYYAETADYAVFMNIQQQYNFALMDEFAALGIDFAYPTQTIYHKSV